jgi:hypothetical protein
VISRHKIRKNNLTDTRCIPHINWLSARRNLKMKVFHILKIGMENKSFTFLNTIEFPVIVIDVPSYSFETRDM